jgi:hypothetical protein
MPAKVTHLMCQVLLALVLLTGCRPVYYGATSIVEFEDAEEHALLGKDFRQVVALLGEPTDIISDKSEDMMWIYEVDETSSNPLHIITDLTTGLLVNRKILMIEFNSSRRVARSDITKSKTHIVGLFGRVNQLTRQIEAKKRVKSVLDKLNAIY